ncbi:hypothetical protein B6I21_05215 [candidate division KSB1 bacterium 4572_119]|nr:MAG: hypothetical protein B6I21_05215 [candidate division KSB1 bacterium 4572_119]
MLLTAEILFASRGFDATGIELIAKTAGITKSLIYYYFKSKDEILNKLFNIFVKKTVAMKKKIVNIWLAEPTLGVDKIIRNYSLPFMLKNKNLIKIIFSESIKDVSEIPHLNIFKYFDQNFNASYEVSEKMGFKSKKNQQDMISVFFLFFAPLFSFVIFSDEWCDYYKIDMKTASGMFADSIGKLYSAFAKEQIQAISLEEILENQPKE